MSIELYFGIERYECCKLSSEKVGISDQIVANIFLSMNVRIYKELQMSPTNKSICYGCKYLKSDQTKIRILPNI